LIGHHPAAGQQRKPSIGYLYPAGGQQGTVVHVTAGGQYLRTPTDIYISGQGVRASVIKYTGSFRFLKKQQQWLFLEKMWNVQEKRLKEAIPLVKDVKRIQAAERKRWPWKKLDNPIDTDGYELPEHPMLIDMENRSLQELAHIQSHFFFPRNKLQDNRQIAEHVLIKVTISPKAKPGARELRIRTGNGMTNPMRFQVGRQREVYETEPNNTMANELAGRIPRLADLLRTETLKLPVLINGQIMPGDIDRFRFRARKGQKLAIEAKARELIPYLADAVPGWFQAVLSLYDADGNEVAFADDNGFNPDPTLRYRVPANGEYELGIRDAIYRGRQDFVYRISLRTVSRRKTVQDPYTAPPDLFAKDVKSLQNPDENEPNNTPARASRIYMPKLVTGRIEKPGDIDLFRLEGRAGDTIVAEVYGRRLGSPLDSLLRLLDASGKVLAWNDDNVLKEKHLHIDYVGLVTHHADSYLSTVLPTTGSYFVQLSDAQRHGGPDYSYQLRISRPRPDFSLRVTPSSLSTRPGGIVPLTVYALRRDGFDGEIKIVLRHDPVGTELAGGIIPAGINQMRMTVAAPPTAPSEPASLIVAGYAKIDKKVIRRIAVPADNVMQAFLWRHLVPAEELLFVIKNQRWAMPPMEWVGDDAVRLVRGETALVRIRTPQRNKKRKREETLLLKLDDPPKGITIEKKGIKPNRGGLEFHLKADKDMNSEGFKVNLIVEVIREFTSKQKEGTPSKKRRQSVGFLPAIPMEIIP